MNVDAISRVIKLVQYLDKESGLILDKPLLAALEIMPQCINNYETNMSKALDELQIVDKEDFARIDELFFDIKIELSLYASDMQKLKYFWRKLFNARFNNQSKYKKRETGQTDEFERHDFIDIIFKRITATIDTFNVVDSEHIFRKKDLRTLQENSDEICQALNNLDNLINERFISKNCCEDIEDLIDAMIMISYDINNVTYAIDFLLNILTKIVDFYNRKAY